MISPGTPSKRLLQAWVVWASEAMAFFSGAGFPWTSEAMGLWFTIKVAPSTALREAGKWKAPTPVSSCKPQLTIANRRCGVAKSDTCQTWRLDMSPWRVPGRFPFQISVSLSTNTGVPSKNNTASYVHPCRQVASRYQQQVLRKRGSRDFKARRRLTADLQVSPINVWLM